jgi:RHH-type rel operon transcriptional repressor/antitoxin RelB
MAAADARDPLVSSNRSGWMTAGAIQADYYDYSDSRGRMPTSVRLDPAIEARLENIVRLTGRSKAFYLRELIKQGLDDLEDAYLGAAALEAHRRSGEAAIPLAVLMHDLGLED